MAKRFYSITSDGSGATRAKGVREVFAAVAESGWHILDKEGAILRPSLPGSGLYRSA
jgi:hypothetical protein